MLKYKLIIINTISIIEEKNTIFDSDNTIQNEIYNLVNILLQCKINNDYSVDFIQSITNLGFNECSKIKEEILKLR